MRNPEDVEQAIRNVMANRAAKAIERDRQNRNMLTALAEVERLEGHMDRDLHTIEALYDELDRARVAQQAEAMVKS